MNFFIRENAEFQISISMGPWTIVYSVTISVDLSPLSIMERARRKEQADRAYELQVKSGSLVRLFHNTF